MLFIDEAHSLFNSDRNDPYGKEAVSTLLKLMEDHKNDLVVIVAGYPDEMDEFVASNPGLKSRFTEELIFEDFTPQELLRIFDLFCAKAEYQVAPSATYFLQQIFEAAYQTRDRAFGNARYARNLFDDIVRSHANRLVRNAAPSRAMLCTIESEDVLPYLPVKRSIAVG